MDCIKIYFFLFSILFGSLFSQECESGFVWIEDVPSCCGAPAQHCFYESDLNILQEMIDNSSETINMLLDDNEDGVMAPVELGFTEWVNGRLVALDCHLSNIMNCNLSGPLPDNFGDLDHLEAVWLNGNQFTGNIPESIGNLSNIELLYLSGNQFTGQIPESICDLDIDFGGANNWGVEHFKIFGNQLCPPYPDCLTVEMVGAQFSSECMNFGDVNGDSDLNILDIVIVANMIIQAEEYMTESDLNQDGSVNILDIIILASFIIESNDQ